jgi:sulfite reductase alpha subunit-like flavoprotein
MTVAFSRQGPKKVYVQNLLKAHAKVVNELLETDGHIYVCGDAKYMARDVQSSFVEILTDERGIHESKSKDILKDMRASSRYQVGDQERTPRLPLQHSLSQEANYLLIP